MSSDQELPLTTVEEADLAASEHAIVHDDDDEEEEDDDDTQDRASYQCPNKSPVYASLEVDEYEMASIENYQESISSKRWWTMTEQNYCGTPTTSHRMLALSHLASLHASEEDFLAGEVACCGVLA
ncbi:hypothetical protein MMC25_002045 [Agyrium rufum]|nr:hypothetical protein [Agyrium rufum]